MNGPVVEGRGLASISLDLDGLRHYARIHGLPADTVPDAVEAVVLERAVPRFLELLARVGARGTLFVIGSEVTAAGRAGLLRALGEGHELATTTRSRGSRPRPSTPTWPLPRRCWLRWG